MAGLMVFGVDHPDATVFASGWCDTVVFVMRGVEQKRLWWWSEKSERKGRRGSCGYFLLDFSGFFMFHGAWVYIVMER